MVFKGDPLVVRGIFLDRLGNGENEIRGRNGRRAEIGRIGRLKRGLEAFDAGDD